MDFTLVKEGEEEPISDSGHSDFYQRSVHLEVDLDEGNYFVYVRLDRILDRNEVCAWKQDTVLLIELMNKPRDLISKRWRNGK